ncbi:MAG: VCBS repeat-containing protein [Chitinophagaceae bacterium]|nr:VCBS repeat-containing protein [Chitinophagaceae bacterium]
MLLKQARYTAGIFFLFCGLLYSCNRATVSNSLFKELDASATGIHFNNRVTENDSVNPLDLEFLYNGGGVGVGDFNNDGLPDLYFTAGMVSNRLYLNKGNLSFADVTEQANVSGGGRWCNAVSVIDINNDGLMDIYLCATIKKDPELRKNILYVNQGMNEDKIPVFKEMASEYGLADTSYSVHAAFFDYDNDGDLDMYLATTRLTSRNTVQFRNRNIADSVTEDFDRLYRNDWNETLGHPVFTDVSKASGIGAHGYALGLAIADINLDGWKDVYVANDFFTSDELYINNGNGTFSNQLETYFKHAAQNAMGTDIADVNNDGLADVITVDMNPEDNFRKKKNLGSANYNMYQDMINGNYALQYIRNTLQLNRGPRMLEHDSAGAPVFSEIGFLAGVAGTDWSWSPLLADFDNDGFRDLMITNGYPRDVTDHDFAVFSQNAPPQISKKELIDQIPQIRIHNYAFRNKGGIGFEDMTVEWGLDKPCFSGGAVYVDLDNDGDLDYVINNINDKAFVYENTLNSPGKITAGYIKVALKGTTSNLHAIGAFVKLYYNNTMQVVENNPVRGYLSTVQDIVHFGVGSVQNIDSIIVQWSNTQRTVLRNVPVNRLITIDIRSAQSHRPVALPVANLFTDITGEAGVRYMHAEMDYADFIHQRLLPHKLSQYGAGLAAGDVNGDGLDDLVTGGNTISDALVFLQQANGKFLQQKLPADTGADARTPESLGILLFDADNDGDLDIYMASGSSEFMAGTPNYQDRLYVNTGSGKFVIDKNALPKNYTSKSCVKAVDFDHDGDLDLFVGGRVLPGKYPQPVSSLLLRNDSKNGHIRFTDVTKEAAKDLHEIGLVSDALWTDFDNDGWEDLVLAGEWMPLVFLKNEKGILRNVTSGTGLAGFTGWWNSIAAGDFDNDGDMDYIAGNLGLNSFYRASLQYPVRIYGNDFDRNGSYDIVTSVYMKDAEGMLKEYPAKGRDEIAAQIPALKKKFPTYKSFGNATIKDIFSANDKKGMLVQEAGQMQSCYIKNNGNGKFEMIPLPVEAQVAPVFAVAVQDCDGDGNLDIVLTGNDFGGEISTGRYDALNGLLLKGDGAGGFKSLSIAGSGIFIPGDGKALAALRRADGHYLLAATQNRDALKIFRLKNKFPVLIPQRGETHALIYLENGSVRRQEFYCGSSFLSQSLNMLLLNAVTDSIVFFDRSGGKRTVTATNKSSSGSK